MNEKNIRVLVIDDEEVIHASIRRILSRFGYEVDGALTAVDGLDKMAEETYNAVITDLMMPKMNGLDMLKAMKERGLMVPAIMITGYPTIKTAVQALRLGAVDYIPKPFTRMELLTPLERTLRRAEADEGPVDADQDPEGEDQAFVQPEVGDRYVLPGHAWCRYNRDNTFDVGVSGEFLRLLPMEIIEVGLPMDGDLVEQGYPGITLKAALDSHCVFMPLSGRVAAVNEEIIDSPKELTAGTWLVRVVASQLREELILLKKIGIS